MTTLILVVMIIVVMVAAGLISSMLAGEIDKLKLRVSQLEESLSPAGRSPDDLGSAADDA